MTRCRGNGIDFMEQNLGSGAVQLGSMSLNCSDHWHALYLSSGNLLGLGQGPEVLWTMRLKERNFGMGLWEQILRGGVVQLASRSLTISSD